VVGAGISGLAAAWELRERADVVVYDPAPPGGRIRTSDFAGRPVDEGPDAFITRSPAAAELCAELGLSGELVAPAAGRTLLWTGGRLQPLPEGLVLGVPRRFGPLARSGLLSPAGLLRAGLDLVLPPTPPPADVGVGELVSRRFGPEVASRLVEPLVGGIHAAPIATMSAAAAAPQLLAAARRSRSLSLGLRDAGAGHGAGPAGAPPLFLAPAGGISRLVQRLVESLLQAGTCFVPAAVRSVGGDGDGDGDGDGSIVVQTTGGGGERFDGAVVTTSSPDAARLLGALAPAALAGVRHSSVALVTVAYEEGEVNIPPGFNGLLVPPGEGRLLTACSFGSNKWPHWSAPGQVVVRASVGRLGDDRADTLDDTALTEGVLADLAAALGATARPLELRLSRWPRSFPFYEVGHLRRMADARRQLAERLPSLALAGSSYDGAGIPACIDSGRRAARLVLGAPRRP